MARAIAILVILIVVAAVIAQMIRSQFPKKDGYGREIVMDDVIQKQARDNYLMLQEYDRFVERLLEADSTLPMLNTPLKTEAERLTRSYKARQLER